MASGNVTVCMAETREFKAAMKLVRQFVDYGNQQYVPDEDMESLMAEAETFLDHGLDGIEERPRGRAVRKNEAWRAAHPRAATPEADPTPTTEPT